MDSAGIRVVPRLVRVASIEAFVEVPHGHFYAGGTFMFWREGPVNGILLWGVPDIEDVLQMARILDVDARPETPRHGSLVDTTALEQIDMYAFREFARQVASRQAVFEHVVDRQAIARPEGFIGVVVAGFYQVFRPTYPTEVFVDRAAALHWLGVENSDELLAALDRVRDEVRRVPSLIGALWAALDTNPRLTLGEAAKQLGTSTRSLQRMLQDHGTAFRTEVSRAQIRIATRILRDTRAPLKLVAQEAGFASSQHFAAAFRRWTGRAPSEFRGGDDTGA